MNPSPLCQAERRKVIERLEKTERLGVAEMQLLLAEHEVATEKIDRLTLTMFGQPLQGTYQLTGDEMERRLNGKTTKNKIKVTAAELEVTGDGNTATCKKGELRRDF